MPTRPQVLAPAEVFRSLDPAGRQAALWAWLARAGHDPRTLWSSCPRGDWLAWWLGTQPEHRRRLVLACAECLRMAESGLPVALDAPRRLVLAASSWADGRAPGSDLGDLIDEITALLARDHWPSATRAALQSSLWLGRLTLSVASSSGRLARRAPTSAAAEPFAPPDASTAAHLTLWHAAAAIACEVNPLEPPGSAWWARCLEAALARFADVLRGCVARPG